MKTIIAVTAVFLATVALSAPVIPADSVLIEQDSVSKLVRIDYALTGEDAIVTIDIQTNNVSIGVENLHYFKGDVNRLVRAGEDKSISWDVRKAWPGHDIVKSLTAVVKAWPTNAPPDYMVVDLIAPNTVRFYASAEELPGGVTNKIYKTEMMAFRKIPVGHVKWRMGSPSSEQGRTANETCHHVTLNDDFYMGVYELTVAQKEIIMGGSSSDMTAHGTDWYGNARGGGYNWPEYKDPSSGSYLGQLRSHVGGGDFDLPLEAQWEFACRAGCPHQFYYTLEDDGTLRERNLADLAVFKDNGSIGSPVGQFLPNAYGLYDMLGSRNEYCRDMWKADNVTNVDPNVGPTDGSGYVIRGGSYHNNWPYCRCAWRVQCTDSTVNTYVPGFRFVCTIGTEP